MNAPRTIRKQQPQQHPTDNFILTTPAISELQDTMAASVTSSSAAALDLFILTFNCAKNLIDVPVFSAHLHAALRGHDGGTGNGLPDLVAFSLQEVAPLSYAFIGSYFLNPYYARYEEALNLASAKLLEEEDEDARKTRSSVGINDDREDDEEVTLLPQTPGSKQQKLQQRPQNNPPNRPYTLIRAKNVGMTAILLFARDPASVTQVAEAECGFGAADMGNKGAVGLRVSWRRAAGETEQEVILVATHLAAMEWNLKKRNANWKSIASGLTFANPRAVLPGVFSDSTAGPTPDQSGAGDKVGPPHTHPHDSSADATVSASRDSSEATSEADDDDDDDDDDGSSTQQPLLPLKPNPNPNSDEAPLTAEHRAALREISVFKPSAHLFVAGDLNYRISSTTPPPLSTFPSFDPASPNHYPAFFSRDQLTQERLAGRAFQGMSEAPLAFGPTYKYDILDGPDGAENGDAVRAGAESNGVPEVSWRFAPHRWPGWCDRVLWLGVPGEEGKKGRKGVEVKEYDSLPVVRTSDHRAVFLRVRVPVLGGEAMRAALKEEEEGDGVGSSKDPRANPPVEVDVHAWERRAAARRKEMAVGLSAFVWSTQEGAILLGTLVLLGVASWWLSRRW